jgi:hypothetical protein
MTITMAAIFMALVTALPAFALELNPCTDDIKQFCGDVTPGGGRLLRCYEDRKDKMSMDCQVWVERLKSNASMLKSACSKEIDSFCNSEKGDPLEMLDCLQGNYLKLSPKCVDKLNEFKYRYPKQAK